MNRNQKFLLWALLLFGLVVRAYGIGFPEHPYFDEKYYVSAGHDYLEGRLDDNSVHPPLAKIQIAAGMLLMDGLKAYHLNPLEDSVGWRLASLIAGVATLWLGFWLALIVTRNVRLSLVALFLLSTDFLQIVSSRITMLDQVQDFWITAGFTACAYHLFRHSRQRNLWLAGLCFGVATACKWNGLFAAFAGVLALTLLSPDPDSDDAARPKLPRWRKFVMASLIFAFCIPAVYCASYTPFLAHEWHERMTNKPAPDDEPRPASVGQFLKQCAIKVIGYHTRMWKFRYDEKQFHHRYLSQFYEWPLVLRPVWYFYEEPKDVEGIIGMGSPVFWWAAAILLIELSVRELRKRVPLGKRESRSDPVGQFLLLLYLPMWLLWACSTTGGFFYYMLPTTPLMAIVVAREVEKWFEDPSSRWGAWAYLALIQIVFILYYPFLTGIAVPPAYFHRLFFDRWI
jgi:dolichyl-phosphate-mannose-protein mannosyltransferase